MNITMLHDGTLLLSFAAVGQTTSISAIQWTRRELVGAASNRIAQQQFVYSVTTLASGELALVYNAMSAAGQ